MPSSNNNHNHKDRGDKDNNNSSTWERNQVHRIFSRSFDTWSRFSKEGESSTSASQNNSNPKSSGATTTDSNSNSNSNSSYIPNSHSFGSSAQLQISLETTDFPNQSQQHQQQQQQLTKQQQQQPSCEAPPTLGRLASPPISSSNNNKNTNMKEEKEADHDDDDEAHPLPRGSIRDIGHSWDHVSDGNNFPIYEIQRIKKKTKKLRRERASEHKSGGSSSNSGTDVFRESGFEDTEGLFQVSSNNSNTNNTAGTGNGQGQSARSRSRNDGAGRSSRDSLSDVLGSADTRTTEGPSGGSSNGRQQQQQQPPQSQAAAKAQRRLLQDFHKPRQVDLLNTSDPVTVNTSAEISTEEPPMQNLTLHDLCGEAVRTDDVAWRNALCLLAVKPALASVVANDTAAQLWTPLHICCLGLSPPPPFVIRALLYVYPKAAAMPDEGGRLPLHLVAASSADAETMQMLVQEHPAAVYRADDHGLTPLHLYLRNGSVELTLEKTKILLGHTATTTGVGANEAAARNNKRNVLQRRGEHLNMTVNSVDQWLSRSKTRPVTNLNHNAMAHERLFDTYPLDVQVSLRKLAQWKHRQGQLLAEESVEVQLSIDDDDDDENDQGVIETNPAAIPLPNGTQWPIHMLVQRVVVDEATLDCSVVVDDKEETKERESDDKDDAGDDDEEDLEVDSSEEKRPSVSHTVSILRLLAAASPEALVTRDANGMTPLLQVMQLNDSLPSLEIVEILLGKRAAGYESLPCWANDLPVHSMKGTDRYINPAMVPVAATGQLPLHLAAEEMSADYSLIHTIRESYPGAVHVQDGRGRTPLHLALHSYRRIPADPRVVELLFSERVAQIVDDYGKLPFDLLVECAHGLPAHAPRTASSGDGAASSVYQKLFSASILGAARPDSPTKLESFLPRLRNLPPWLRTEACATTFVQDLLTEEIAKPWKCAVILLDGLLLVILITVFRLQMKEFVDQLESADLLSSWYTYTVYATAVCRLFAQFLYGGLAVSIGEFRHLCAFNLWYWIDVWAMLFSIVTSVFLYGAASDERLLVLGTASTILLWLSLIGYLSSWWYGMAIFTGGFSKIANRIVYPFITAGVLIIAFAQCFYTLLQLDCSDAIAVSPVCSVRDAYRVVYMLGRGGSLVDPTGVERLSTEAVLLVTMFLLVFAIFLLALLVTVLIAASHLDFDQIALNAYWEPKLAFVLSAGDLGVANGDFSDRKEGFEAKKAQMWDVFMLTLLGGEPVKGANWFARPLPSKVFTLVTAMFVVPLWFMLGLCSLGLLWPPQLRLWLFRPQGICEKERCAQVTAEQSRPQISDIRTEIVQMKLMSYERSMAQEHELRELKELLLIAMQE